LASISKGKRRIKSVAGGAVGELHMALEEASRKLEVPDPAQVRSCYEAG